MDTLDEEILHCLAQNARMTVKEIAAKVALTSPAVSERIKRMEKRGIIAGYTVIPGEGVESGNIHALISISVTPSDRQYFLNMIETQPHVRQCFHVTGSYSFIVKVSCVDMQELEQLINRYQKLGQTSTQIVLSTPVDRPATL